MGGFCPMCCSCAIHVSMPYISACETSGGVMRSESAVLSWTRAMSRAVVMFSCEHRITCSSVSSRRRLQFLHLLSIALLYFDSSLCVGVHLCCNLVILVCRYCGSLLVVRPIAFHAI